MAGHVAKPDLSDDGLRVLIVCAYALPHLGGVEVVVAQQAQTLTALGAEVTVLTSNCGKAASPPDQPAARYRITRIAAWNVLEERKGIPLPLWSPAIVWELAKLVRRSDVVHVHDVYHPSSIAAAIVARWHRRPLFITQHVAIVDHDHRLVELAQRFSYAVVGRLLWRWATTITAYNPIVAAFITGHGVAASKVRLTYNGVDTSLFRPGDPAKALATRVKYGLAPDRPVVLFAGRLVPKKGADKLIAAASSEYQIVLAGPGKIPDAVPPGVLFVGPVSRDELLSLYQASDIFALPAAGEMLTLAMQEAMACGLPVVTTAHEAYARYELDPAGVALVPADSHTLRLTFLDILSNQTRRDQMRSYSRQLAVKRFDWQQNAGALAADYDAAHAASRTQ